MANPDAGPSGAAAGSAAAQRAALLSAVVVLMAAFLDVLAGGWWSPLPLPDFAPALDPRLHEIPAFARDHGLTRLHFEPGGVEPTFVQTGVVAEGTAQEFLTAFAGWHRAHHLGPVRFALPVCPEAESRVICLQRRFD